MEFVTLFISGLIVGILGSFLGVSGGVIIVPIMTIFLGYPIHDAIAVSLVVVVANSTAISPSYLKSGLSNLRLGETLALGSVIGALAGSVISVSLPQKTLYIIMGVIQLAVSIIMWLKSRSAVSSDCLAPIPGSQLNGTYYDESEGQTKVYGIRAFPATLGISTASGVLSGLVGVGGGVFIVPAMNIVAKLPIKAATATSNLVVGFTAAAGGTVFFLSGYLKPLAVVGMVLGLFISSRFAVKLFNKLRSKLIIQMFVILMFIVAIQMLYKGFTW